MPTESSADQPTESAPNAEAHEAQTAPAPRSPEERSSLEDPPLDPPPSTGPAVTTPGGSDDLASPVGLTASPAEAEDEVRASDVIDPTSVRRAPRFKSFVLAGVGVGVLLGLIIGLIAFRNASNQGYMVAVLVVDLTFVTTLIALIWAILAERRSRRRG